VLALRDGWYVTGDIAFLDAQGYIHITDRLSRFSKIGGEMVPHGRIEEALHMAAGVEPTVFAVTSVPDKRKGESLAVLHTFDKKKVQDLIHALHDQGLPNLFIPKPDHFIKIKEMPLLGNGKLDLKKLKNTALEQLA
ncbi:MAG: acyl-[ACP]--phospholipid O-acyltransferase, partial [Chlamydiia bacterium]|nr:acyl-[ACP]--phospholipid O-acyltransferase [Chlamydiia bacterium]